MSIIIHANHPLSSTLIIPISLSTFNLIHTCPAGPLLISHGHVITMHGNGQHLLNLLLNLSYVHATAPFPFAHRPLSLSFLIRPPPSTYSFHIHHIPITPTSMPIYFFSISINPCSVHHLLHHITHVALILLFPLSHAYEVLLCKATLQLINSNEFVSSHSPLFLLNSLTRHSL